MRATGFLLALAVSEDGRHKRGRPLGMVEHMDRNHDMVVTMNCLHRAGAHDAERRASAPVKAFDRKGVSPFMG